MENAWLTLSHAGAHCGIKGQSKIRNEGTLLSDQRESQASPSL